MTTNQIMIPLSLLLLIAWVVFLVVRSRRNARASAQRDHRHNTPVDGRDGGAVARSAMQGHASGGGGPT